MSLARSALDVVSGRRRASWEAFALLKLGDAELALGRHSAAHETFARAHTVALEIDDTIQHDAAAGLARVALAEGNGAAALQAMQPVLDHIAGGGTLEGTDARMIEWTMHRVLAQAHHPRAGEWLARARDALQAQAERLRTPELRHGFLNNIPHHREIVAAWASRMNTQGSQAVDEVASQILRQQGLANHRHRTRYRERSSASIRVSETSLECRYCLQRCPRRKSKALNY